MASSNDQKSGPGIRLIDATGSSSSVGLLQLPVANGFGTVCGMNLGAADVVCIELNCLAKHDSAATTSFLYT